ncbi:MAG: hypothetical protein H0V17_05630 [Deltaproteobacteria bacterium]|nr:hypothetical protein [Deltaproteobacteria bacterium]
MPAGSYHVIYDAIITAAVDVTFELIHRRGSEDTTLATWSQHFEPRAAGFEAQEFEIDQPAPAIDFASGDLFIYRYSGASSTLEMAYIPVGFPESEGGRQTNITLPR